MCAFENGERGSEAEAKWQIRVRAVQAHLSLCSDGRCCPIHRLLIELDQSPLIGHGSRQSYWTSVWSNGYSNHNQTEWSVEATGMNWLGMALRCCGTANARKPTARSVDKPFLLATLCRATNWRRAPLPLLFTAAFDLSEVLQPCSRLNLEMSVWTWSYGG